MRAKTKTAAVSAPSGALRAKLLGVGTLAVVLVFGAWYALRSNAEGRTRTDADEASALGTPDQTPPRAAAEDAGSAAYPVVAARRVCTNSWFPLAVGSARNYRTNTGAEDGTLSLSLVAIEETADATHASWRAQITQPSGVESDATAVRRCEADVAEEPWFGWGIESLMRFADQTWRYPNVLRPGLAFGGTTNLFVLTERHAIERQHRVVGRERVSTPAGAFDAWRIDYDDHETERLHGTYWIAEGPGMVRTEQDNGTTQTVYELTSWSNP